LIIAALSDMAIIWRLQAASIGGRLHLPRGIDIVAAGLNTAPSLKHESTKIWRVSGQAKSPPHHVI
jgi:hypothetical protein